MCATNTEHYTLKQNSVAVVLKALGHPARIAIIEYLVRAGKCICCDIIMRYLLPNLIPGRVYRQ